MSLQIAKDICFRELLLPFEGTGPTTNNGDFIAYKDPAGKDGLPITIAWGLTFDEIGQPIKLGDVWSYERAAEHKKNVLNTFLLALLKSSPKLALEPPRRIAAVLSWVYNCGMGNYRISTFKKKVDAGDWMEAAEQCKKWNKANGKVMRGLTRRRAVEAAYILLA